MQAHDKTQTRTVALHLATSHAARLQLSCRRPCARCEWIYTAMMTEASRVRRMNLMLRLSDDERALLEALAKATGLKMADVLRQALRNEARRRGLDPAPKRTATPSKKK